MKKINLTEGSPNGKRPENFGLSTTEELDKVLIERIFKEKKERIGFREASLQGAQIHVDLNCTNLNH